MRRAHLLDRPAPDVGAALAHHGYVQIDPINVCGRMHDHILRNRVAGYAEGGLMRHLHGPEGGSLAAEERRAFEHHLPSTNVLAALPLDAWPHLRAAMLERSARPNAWLGRLTARERELAGRILGAIAGGRALGPEAFEDGRKGRRVWGSATLAKATLQKLFFHGRVLIAGRRGNRRLYDLPERVLPAAVLAERERSLEETARWLAINRLRQHRLAALRRAELSLVEDVVQPIAVEGCPMLYCLVEDLRWFEPGPRPGPSAGEPVLLAPLDPVVYDRRVTRDLWGFDYAWEAYMPAARRKRGYYALPVLAGTEIVGHVDVKADRARGRLDVVSSRLRGGRLASDAVARLASFLGLGFG
jgi:hypothetical protein